MKKNIYTNLTYFFFILILYVVNIQYISSQPIDANHTGLILFPLNKLEKGFEIYSQFQNLYNPFFSYLINFILITFKNNYLNLIYLNYFFYFLISILLLIQGIILNKPFIGFLSSFLSFILNPFHLDWMMPWPNIMAVLFILFSINFFILFLKTNKNLFYFISLLFAFLIFFIRDQFGIFYLVMFFLNSCVIYFHFVENKNNFIRFSITYLVIIAFSFIFLFYIFGILGHATNYFINLFSFVYEENVWKSNTENFFNYLLRVFFPIVKPMWNVTNQASFLPIFLSLYLFFVFYKNKIDKVLFSVAFLSLSSWIQYFPLPDIHHTYWGYLPMINIFLILFVDSYKNLFFGKFLKIFLSLIFLTIIFSSTVILNFNNYIHYTKFPGRSFDNINNLKSDKYCTTSINDSFYYGIKDTCESISFYDEFYKFKNQKVSDFNKLIVIGPYPIFYLIFDELEHPFFWYNNMRLVNNKQSHYKKLFENIANDNKTLIITSDLFINEFHNIDLKILKKYENVKTRNFSQAFEGKIIYLISY